MDMSDISDQTNDLFFLWFCKNPPFKRNRHGRIFEKAGRFGKFFSQFLQNLCILCIRIHMNNQTVFITFNDDFLFHTCDPPQSSLHVSMMNLLLMHAL